MESDLQFALDDTDEGAQEAAAQSSISVDDPALVADTAKDCDYAGSHNPIGIEVLLFILMFLFLIYLCN